MESTDTLKGELDVVNADLVKVQTDLCKHDISEALRIVLITKEVALLNARERLARAIEERERNLSSGKVYIKYDSYIPSRPLLTCYDI